MNDDLISRQAAIDALTKDKKALEQIISEMSGYEKEFDRFVGQRNQVDCDIYAIEQLPPAQPEQTNCDYCHEDADGYVKPIEKNGHAFVRFGMNGWELELKVKGWHGEAKIQYCPICGRKL